MDNSWIEKLTTEEQITAELQKKGINKQTRRLLRRKKARILGIPWKEFNGTMLKKKVRAPKKKISELSTNEIKKALEGLKDTNEEIALQVAPKGK
jgi:hypothetical protein